jgi:hypothetical protein
LMLQILCIAKMHIYNISTMCIYNISTMCIYNCCKTYKKNEVLNSKYYLLLIILVFSCKPKTENFYYPSFEKLKEIKIDTLNLEKLENYNELISKLENLNYGEKYGFLKLKNENRIYNLSLTTRHGFCYGGPITKRKNLITVSEDSIMKNEELFHLSHLTEILEKDLKNNGKENEYAESSEKLRISLALKNPENFVHLEEYLFNIIGRFNQLNNEKNYELNIQIDREFYFWRNLREKLPK